ncbi:hypothetical protein KAT92_06570 [Candidatus Babeliales bacterium]|nr:hypothetical protein [Candidatus Babeliales bacterium]
MASTRERARARARAKAKDVSFGAGISPDQLAKPEPDIREKAGEYYKGLREQYDAEGMTGFGAEMPERGVIPGVMGAIGGAFGGVPSVAGYTTGQQIDKYMRGEDIKAKDVAKETAMNALMEAGPGMALRGASKMLPKGLPSRMMQSAVKPSSTFGQSDADRKVQALLENEIAVSKDGMKKLKGIIKEGSEDTTRVISEAARQGDTLDPNIIYDQLLKMEDDLSIVMGSGAGTQIKALEDEVEYLMKQFGDKPIPVDKMLDMKRATDKFLNTYFTKLSKGGVDPITLSQHTKMGLASNTVRDLLNKQYKQVAENNKRISPLISASSDIDRRLVMNQNRNLIPFGFAEASALAKAMGGDPATGAGLIGLKHMAEAPGIKSKAAIGLQRAQQGNVLGGMGKSTTGARQNLFNEYLDNQKEQDKATEERKTFR